MTQNGVWPEKVCTINDKWTVMGKKHTANVERDKATLTRVRKLLKIARVRGIIIT